MPLVQADARAIPLEDQSVQCVVTSPPYWGLRDYQLAGQLGLEPTPEEYVAKMVEAFREVRRVLRDDGTCWLYMGDCYNSTTGFHRGEKYMDGGAPRVTTYPDRSGCNLKTKDLVGMPWRVAFALQADGWYLRADIIWAKGLSFCPNYSGSVMPESVQVRPTKGHEYLFLLTKRARYFYDAEAVKEVGVIPEGTKAAKGSGTRQGNRRPEEYATYTGTRNLRSVWAIGTKPFKEAHFATFPPKLVEPCIKAGTSEKGCCAACGAPWVREVKRKVYGGHRREGSSGVDGSTRNAMGGGQFMKHEYEPPKTTGWRPSCTCTDPSPLPCIVLDPFAGSGTVGLVCHDLGRLGVCCDLKLEYLYMARERIR